VGALLVAGSCVWTVFLQGCLWTMPSAVASEAPDRHFSDQKTFAQKDAYDLSFSLAKDITNRMPNILIPTGLLLLGSWLLFSSPKLLVSTQRRDCNKNS